MLDLQNRNLDTVALGKYVIALSRMLDAESNKERDDLVVNASEFTGFDKDTVYQDFFLYLEQECKIKVREAIRSENTAKKAYIKTQVLSWLRKFFETKEAIRVFDAYSVEAKEAETFQLGELFELARKQQTKYIVKELIEVGVLLILAATAKTGKSLIATYLANCVAQGKEFLGRVTDPCGVLFIQNEERLETTTAPRFYDQGLQNLEAIDPVAFNELVNSDKLVIARGMDIGVDLTTIMKTAIDKNCKLVIIDSLRASLRKSGMTDLSPEVPGLLYALQEECHKHGITVLLIHHNTKLAAKPNDKGNRGKADLINGMGGLSGIAAANDGMIFAFPVESDEAPRPILLHFIPRTGGEMSLTIEYREDEACFWEFTVTEESTMSAENLALQNSILRLLYARYNQWKERDKDNTEEVPVYGCTLQELISLTDCQKKSLVTVLNFMLRREGICRYSDPKAKKHIYCIHPSGESWMQVYLLKEDKEKEEMEIKKEIELRLARQLENITTLEELKELTGEWTTDLKRRVQKHLNPETLSRIHFLSYPPKYGVGDAVLLDKNLDPAQEKAYKISEVYYHLESKRVRYKLEGLELDYAEEQLSRDSP